MCGCGIMRCLWRGGWGRGGGRGVFRGGGGRGGGVFWGGGGGVSGGGGGGRGGVGGGVGGAFGGWRREKGGGGGRIGAGDFYRLPTDAEWSVAAGLVDGAEGTPAEKSERGGAVYPWGTQWPPVGRAGNYCDVRFF